MTGYQFLFNNLDIYRISCGFCVNEYDVPRAKIVNQKLANSNPFRMDMLQKYTFLFCMP